MLALSRRGWYHLALGDVEASRRCFEEARSIDPEHCDPYDLVELATNHTDLLLQTGAGADEVVAAAAEALQTADEYGLDTFIVGMLIANVGQALREAGRVGEAARLVLPASEDAPAPTGGRSTSSGSTWSPRSATRTPRSSGRPC